MMKGKRGSISGEDVFARRPVSIFDIETKQRTDFDSLKSCAMFLKMRPDSIRFYIRSKNKRNYNGRKYAIRYTSSLTPKPKTNE